MAVAVADATLPSPPPPPPARIVVAVLALVRFALAPMLALGHVLCVAARALPYLGFAVAWVISAAVAAQVVARRAWGESSAPFLFFQALMYGGLKVLLYSILVLLLALAALLLCGLCVAYVTAVLSGSVSEFKKHALGAITWDSAANSFKLPRTVVLGLMVDVPFILLVVSGLLVAMMSHVEGSVSLSRGEMVGFAIADVGIFGVHAIYCFLIIPALALDVWREGQAISCATLQIC